MLSSITPLGERGRNNRWWLTVACLPRRLGRSVALLLGGVLGAARHRCFPARRWRRWARSRSAALAGLLVELRSAVSALPTNHRQVNERWLDDLSWLGLRPRLRVPARPRRGHDRHQRRDVPHVRRGVPRPLGPRRPGHRRSPSASSGRCRSCSPRRSAIRPACAACSRRNVDAAERARSARSRWAGAARSRGGNPSR